jgi:hypothetical protein
LRRGKRLRRRDRGEGNRLRRRDRGKEIDWEGGIEEREID